jgi:hypothetical protein
MVDTCEYEFTQLVVWQSYCFKNLVIAYVMIRINPSLPIALSKDTVTLLMLIAQYC